MSNFNAKATAKTANKSGHAAYKMTDKEKLVTQVLTTFFNEPKYYGDNSGELMETAYAVIAKEPEFVAKLAIYARTVFNMRSVSHVLCAMLANRVKGAGFVRTTIAKCCVRGDDITEILACYISMYGKPIPNSLWRGLKDALKAAPPYAVAKYQGSDKAVKMADAIKLCHPKPGDVFKDCIEETLPVPTSWETELSKGGNTKETWERLIAERKIGYMAALRNLRNMVNANPSNIDEILSMIADPERVKKSRQLPFRFHTAYKQMKSAPNAGSKVLDALEDAMSASVANMPELPGTTVIAVDCSGSMTYSPISRKSTATPMEIASVLGVCAAVSADNAILYAFSDDAVKVNVSRRGGILAQSEGVYTSVYYHGGTNMHAPFDAMIRDGVRADRVIVLSDNEVNSRWNDPVQKVADEYRRKTGSDCWVHAIDLQGYGTQQFHGAKTDIIAGWSERVLEFVPLAEQGAGGIVAQIEGTVL